MLQGISSFIFHLDSICKLITIDYTFYEALTSSFWWSANRPSTWCRTEDRSRGTRWREIQSYSSSGRAFKKTSWSWLMKICRTNYASANFRVLNTMEVSFVAFLRCTTLLQTPKFPNSPTELDNLPPALIWPERPNVFVLSILTIIDSVVPTPKSSTVWPK